MFSRALFSTFAFGILAIQCLAFKRTAPDISPFDLAYTNQAGEFNLTKNQITPGQFINSYWTIYFIAGSNNHDYFLVGQALQSVKNGTTTNEYRASLLDINDGYYSGITYVEPNSTMSEENFSFVSSRFQTYSTSKDRLSTMTSISSIENVTFHLTSEPKGPNLYDGGNALFSWGNNWTYEWAAPECYVTGNLTYKGEVIDVIPEKSMSWYDRQFGPGYGTNGWNLFIFHLNNGVKSTVWNSKAVGDGTAQNFATFLYPDGHHEISLIDANTHQSRPFTSKHTNITHYGRHEVHIPGQNTSLVVELPVLAGEMAADGKDNTHFNVLFEGYSTVKGYFKGEQVTGFGVTEHSVP